MCKHIHVALNVAAMRNIDIKKSREEIAQELVNQNQFFIDDVGLTVFYNDNANTIISGTSCSCIAASFELECIEKLIFKQLQHNNEETYVNVPVEEVKSTSSNKISTVQRAQSKLADISSWLEQQNPETQKTKDICKQITELHSQTKLEKFVKISRKRKIQVNNVARSLINKAKKKRGEQDHLYIKSTNRSDSKSSYKNEDGSSKRKSRRKKTTRTVFQ